MPQFSDSIAVHASYIIKNFYQKPYPSSRKNIIEQNAGIFRLIHGGQHVSGVAFLMLVLANLYRQFGHEEALALTDDDIKLLQIAALFHDCAREGEEQDKWELPSALHFYNYCVNQLKIDPQKAKTLAEALVNKDEKPFYYEFDISSKTWVSHLDDKQQKKSIWQILIHDADCLEILRARDIFDARYLDFYQLLAKHNKDAFQVMHELICEFRRFLAHQGNARHRLNLAIKKTYELDEHCFEKTVGDVDDPHGAFNVLKAYYANNHLLTAEQLKTLKVDKNLPSGIDKELTQKLHHGDLFLRSIIEPSMYDDFQKETNLCIEIKKLSRDSEEKKGNPYRSISLAGAGANSCRSVGLIISPDKTGILCLSPKDINSGWAKKTILKGRYAKVSQLENQLKLIELFEAMKLGGKSFQNKSTHTEIIYNLEKQDVDAIYYSTDPSLDDRNNASLTWYHCVPVLKALYIQQIYKKQLGKELPIYEYSGVKNTISKKLQLSEQDILLLWETLAQDYLVNERDLSFLKLTVNELKDRCLLIDNKVKTEPLDTEYTKELQDQLNDRLTKTILKHHDKNKKILLDKFNDVGQPDYNFPGHIESLNGYLEHQLVSVDDFNKDRLQRFKKYYVDLLSSCVNSPLMFIDSIYRIGSVLSFLKNIGEHTLRDELLMTLEKMTSNIINEIQHLSTLEYGSEELFTQLLTLGTFSNTNNYLIFNHFFESLLDEKKPITISSFHTLYLILNQCQTACPQAIKDNASKLVSLLIKLSDSSNNDQLERIFDCMAILFNAADENLEKTIICFYKQYIASWNVFHGNPFDALSKNKLTKYPELLVMILSKTCDYRQKQNSLHSFIFILDKPTKDWNLESICKNLAQYQEFYSQGYPEVLIKWIQEKKQEWLQELLKTKDAPFGVYEEHIDLYLKYPFLGSMDKKLLEEYMTAITRAYESGKCILRNDVTKIKKVLTHPTCTLGKDEINTFLNEVQFKLSMSTKGTGFFDLKDSIQEIPKNLASSLAVERK